jgi:hypothetical protein
MTACKGFQNTGYIFEMHVKYFAQIAKMFLSIPAITLYCLQIKRSALICMFLYIKQVASHKGS